MHTPHTYTHAQGDIRTHIQIQVHARIYTHTILYIYLLTTLNYLIAYEYSHAGLTAVHIERLHAEFSLVAVGVAP